MRMEETELRINTNQWVKTNFLPKICNYLSYADYYLTNKTVAAGPSEKLQHTKLHTATSRRPYFHTEKYLLEEFHLHMQTTRTRPRKDHFRVPVTHCLPYITMKELFNDVFMQDKKEKPFIKCFDI